MINFRYHVVSLTAVFLALAIGLVVGTAALNGPVADSLKDRVNALSKNNEQLRESVNNMETEVKREEDFLTEAAPHLLGGKLAGRRVLLLTLPTGREHVDGVAEMLRMAGASVTGRIDLQDKFIHPDNNYELLGMAARSARPTIPSSGLPGNSDGVETSSALLASALLDRPEGGSPVTDVDRQAVLDEYSGEGYLTVSDKIGTAVVAGSGSSGGNVVAEVRRDPALSKTISTVDNANTVAGQVVTALATVRQLVDKKAGAYGVGADAESLLPKLPE